ncbi:ArsR family transcriptional regulator [Stappia sp. BW2]|nr:ArsR family transcriptional regulator [Stappia sp. BW2]
MWELGRMTMDTGTVLADAPRAPAFIVTIYGDVVEPRGGMLWMGTLIDCCAAHGLSESLVRTAMSRLVAAGRLEGVRVGRKSYYRLSEAARDEFHAAAKLLFRPTPATKGWLICLSETSFDQELADGWVRFSPTVALAPDRPDVTRMDGVLMAARHLGGYGDLRALAWDKWGLEAVAAAYDRFQDRHGWLMSRLAGETPFPSKDALDLRLRLVHDYRLAALNDPRLPEDACPPDWPADRARQLFVRAYVGLSAPADRYVGEVFLSNDGALPTQSAGSERRLIQLNQEIAAWAENG